MSILVKTKTWANGEAIQAADLNADFDTLYDAVNGGTAYEAANFKDRFVDGGRNVSKAAVAAVSTFNRRVLGPATAGTFLKVWGHAQILTGGSFTVNVMSSAGVSFLAAALTVNVQDQLFQASNWANPVMPADSEILLRIVTDGPFVGSDLTWGVTFKTSVRP